MITRQHTAVTLMAHEAKASSLQTFRKEIPWVLLPDAIRAYSGGRQVSHFEELPDGTDTAWMIFPGEELLKQLSKKNMSTYVKTYLPEGYPQCVIGEKTNINAFDQKNYGNRHYHSLRMHMVQDTALDKMLREELVNVEERFQDKFVIRWNNQKIDGATFRRQIALFADLGFIHLAGKVYKYTGITMNNQWLAENVLSALEAAYPEDLAANTFKYIILGAEEDSRISKLDFEFTEKDKEDFFLCNPDELEDMLDDLYARAFYFTTREL